MNVKVDIIIPAYKPGKDFHILLNALEEQTVLPHKIIIMNTVSNNDTGNCVKSKSENLKLKYNNIEIYDIAEKDFDHGKTRDLGIKKSSAPYFLCMTQDAIPKDKYLIEHMLQSFDEEDIAICYGRQLAGNNSHILEEYSRQFNYPEISMTKSLNDKEKLGIKTYFCSNVCAMYRRSVYDSLDGFIKKTIFNEDMIFAATAIEAGFKVRYQANACVIHSHQYTCIQQFRRNFDLGISQADHPEIFKKISSEKEGGKLIKGTLSYLIHNKKPYVIPYFICQSFYKYLGYRLGKAYKKLPLFLTKKWSMNKNYWL